MARSVVGSSAFEQPFAPLDPISDCSSYHFWQSDSAASIAALKGWQANFGILFRHQGCGAGTGTACLRIGDEGTAPGTVVALQGVPASIDLKLRLFRAIMSGDQEKPSVC
jgi:hypothetical protein